MAFEATVLRVMIASPSDTVAARDAVEDAINRWNDAHSMRRRIVLQPWRWETSAVPVLGSHPQALINSQGVDSSDIVFALFGSRLGSPTPDAVSGTVAEVQRSVQLGKPVHIYFSTAALPNDVDTAQIDGIRDFRRRAQSLGLLGEFSDVAELTHMVWRAVELDVQNVRRRKSPTIDEYEHPQRQYLQLRWGSRETDRQFGMSRGALPEDPDDRAGLLAAVALEKYTPYLESVWRSIADIDIVIRSDLALVPDSAWKVIEGIATKHLQSIRVKSLDGSWVIKTSDGGNRRGKWKPTKLWGPPSYGPPKY